MTSSASELIGLRLLSLLDDFGGFWLEGPTSCELFSDPETSLVLRTPVRSAVIDVSLTFLDCR